jgi:hypothetical protein
MLYYLPVSLLQQQTIPPLILKHQAALVLVVLNLLLFFISNKYATLLTGGILLLATFNLLAFFPEIVSTIFGLGNMKIPAIQGKSFLLLLLYVVINFKVVRTRFDD